MKTRPRLLGLVGVLLVGGVFAFWFIRAEHQRVAVAPWIPARPVVTGFPSSFNDALSAADSQARSRSNAREGLRKLSALYHANGFFTEAITCYEGLAALEPEEARWLHLHASILAGFGQAEEALALWEQMIKQAPDYLPARLRMGDVALKAGDLTRAAAAYDAALLIDDGNPYALHGLARIKLERGDEQGALELLETVVRRSNYTLGYDLIVTLYENAGMDAEALSIRGNRAVSGAYQDPPDPWLDALIASNYDPFQIALAAGKQARGGDRKTAIALLQRAVELDPSDVSLHYQLGDLYLAEQQIDDAIAKFRLCTLLDPSIADGWGKLSSVFAQTGRITEAEDLLNAGLKAAPQSHNLHRMRARRLFAKGNISAAIADYRTAIQHLPNDAGSYVDLGMLLQRQGRTAEAIQQFETALVYDPVHPTALKALAYQAIESSDRSGAGAWLVRLAAQSLVTRDELNQIREAYGQQFGALPPN